MKAILIKWLLPILSEMIVSALVGLARKSDNTIDDNVVKLISDNKDNLIDEIKANL